MVYYTKTLSPIDLKILVIVNMLKGYNCTKYQKIPPNDALATCMQIFARNDLLILANLQKVYTTQVHLFQDWEKIQLCPTTGLKDNRLSVMIGYV